MEAIFQILIIKKRNLYKISIFKSALKEFYILEISACMFFIIIINLTILKKNVNSMNLIDELDYHIWAEKQFMTQLEKVSDDDWATINPDINKSLQSIYAHKLEVMWFWFHQASEKKLENEPTFNTMDKNETQKLLEELIADNRRFILQYENKQLQLNIPWNKSLYTITSHEILFNIFNHHTYHRGQIAILLKKLNIEPPETDYNPYMYSKLGL